jgi:predicted ribosome quality control (RQC) complex YloA/Tae2 family protein
MAYDGVLINSIVNELKENFISGRVDKIHQPEKDLLHISIWCKSKTQKILLSCNPDSPRIHITKEERVNPKSPPMFCMLLRRHLLAGRIVDITQPSFDRIVELHVEILNEFGDLTIKKLIIECMGKHSNIILIDDSSRIIDSIKHINFDTSRVREILPGKKYEYPPLQGKISPLSQNAIVLTVFNDESKSLLKSDELISSSFTGISRVTAQEIANRYKLGDFPSLSGSFVDFFEKVSSKSFSPTLLQNDLNQPVDIFPFNYHKYPLSNQKEFKSPSDLVEHFYAQRDRNHRMEQSLATINRVIKTNLDRLEKKLALQHDELHKAKESEKYRLYGEIITANLHLPLSGLDEVELCNYYEPEAPKIVIPIDKSKTLSQNAQEYFKKFTKSKNAVKVLSEQIASTNGEIDYLESQLHNVDKCTEDNELEEVIRELTQEGYIKESSKNVRKATTPSEPHRFVSSDGFEIFVGKNNVQNDTLTLKTAGVSDIWMHTKNIPGSHVIIRSSGKSVPHSTILEGAMLAAYFSKARNSANIPIDYCPRKNIKKPRGSKLGMVIYEKYRTLYITPLEKTIKGIFASKGKIRDTLS